MSLINSIRFIKLVSRGFSNEYATWYLKNCKKFTGIGSSRLSLYDYCYLHSQNDVFGKWLIDKAVSRHIYQNLSSCFPKTWFMVFQRFGEQNIVDLGHLTGSQRTDMEHLLNFIRDKGKVFCTGTRGLAGNVLSYEEGRFHIDGKDAGEAGIRNFFAKNSQVLLIQELLAEDMNREIARLICCRVDGELKVTQSYMRHVDLLAESSVDHYVFRNEIEKDYGKNVFEVVDSCEDSQTFEADDSLRDLVKRMGEITPQINLMALDVYIAKGKIFVLDIFDHPPYPKAEGLNDDTEQILLDMLEEKRAVDQYRKSKVVAKKIDTVFWIGLEKLFSPKKMRPLVFKEWMTVLKKDFFSKNGVSLGNKIKAYKKGFLSYRIRQYGITEDNIKQNISDYDYAFLKHINPKYRILLEDKMSLKYICASENESLPEYYYQIKGTKENVSYICLMDLPKEYGGSREAFFRFVREKKILACKPQRGSHGAGFIKLTYDGKDYRMNDQVESENGIAQIILDPIHEYLVTEYIALHPVLKKVYPGSVNTMRVIAFRNEEGNFEIGNIYLRFGNSKTGGVDNMGAGGMFAAVDVDTGHFHSGKTIHENIITACPYHPDTGIPIDGYIPDWDDKKNKILAVAECIPYLDYLGIDVAITENGIKIPEVNRAPEYPMIENLSVETIRFLLNRLEIKNNFS